jgi:hypothetical protein
MPAIGSDTERAMARHRILTVIVLALWVFLGPVAMAFGGCFLMGAMCDGPCGTSSLTSFVPAPATGPEPMAYLETRLQSRLPDTALAAAEPPPKHSAVAS